MDILSTDPRFKPVPHRGLVTLSIMLATIMQTLDSTIANVALPHMQGSLSASQDQITWVLTSYIVAAAIATPVTGWICDRYGRKQIFLIAVIGFTAASILCGISESLSQIVLARLLQGVFGAALVPLSQATLLDINPRDKQGSAMAYWGMGVMVGPILGPTLGGWLTESFDWRWVFFINVPIGAIALYGISRYMRESRAQNVPKFDFTGFATLSLAIGFLQLCLDRGEQLDWLSSNEITLEAVGAVVAFSFFIAHTWTATRDSFFDTRILRDRNYVSGVLVIFIIGLVMYATRALLPPMLQTLMNYPAIDTGLVMAPSGAGTMFAMLIAGRIVTRIEPRKIMAFGFCLTILSLWQMAHYTVNLNESDIIWPGIIQGIGLGFVFVPLSTTTFSTLSAGLRPAGTSIFSLSRNIGSSIGISIVQTLYTRNSGIAHSYLSEHVNVYNPNVQDYMSAAGQVDLTLLNLEVSRQASMLGYLADFRFMLVITFMSMPVLLLIRPRKKWLVAASEAAHVAID